MYYIYSCRALLIIALSSKIGSTLYVGQNVG